MESPASRDPVSRSPGSGSEPGPLEPVLQAVDLQKTYGRRRVVDGVGFDVQSVNQAYDKRGSLGMVNLRERTELVSGLLNIQSEPGKGTHIQVYVPLTEEAADRLHHAKH